MIRYRTILMASYALAFLVLFLDLYFWRTV